MRIDREEFGRRAFLASLVAVLAGACSGSEPVPEAAVAVPATSTPLATVAPAPIPTAAPQPTPSARHDPSNPEYPFTLGIASGDPTSDSVILWTRLLPATPLATEVEVTWELATDASFGSIVASGTALTAAHSVHVDATGLSAHTWYSYRFRYVDHYSATGRTRTTPAADADTDLTFAFSSCQRRWEGHYAAHRSLAEAGDDIDLFFWLGDYIYEEPASGGERLPSRAHAASEAITLEDYRDRYVQYKSDPDLQAHHAARPWVVTWDDHEVVNDYDATVDPQRRAAAYQAWYEHMPVRLPAPVGTEPWVTHREFRWGRRAHFFVLDGRQYRDPQPESNQAALTYAGSMLGGAQQQWLVDGANASDATWTILPQQTMMSGLDASLSTTPETPLDTWDGYRANRAEVLGQLSELRNLVVLSGDLHMQAAANLKPDPFDRASPVVGTELMAGAISSQFLSDLRDLVPLIPFANGHIHHADAANGYVVCTVGADQLRATFVSVAEVTDPASPVGVSAEFTISDGVPGISR